MSTPETIVLQRNLTKELLRKRRLNAPVVWLKSGATSSSSSDADKAPERLDTDFEQWGESDRNLGVRLVDGLIEIRVWASPAYLDCLFRAFAHTRVDARASFGVHQVSSILIRIEDPFTIDRWQNLWPQGFKTSKTELIYSLMPIKKTMKMVWRDSQPLPGSVVDGKIVSWRPLGKPAASTVEDGIEDFEARPVASTAMSSVVRAIAWATLLYWIRIYLDKCPEWDESLRRTIAGWLARQIPEGQDINLRGKSLEGVCWSPLDSEELAFDLIDFLDSGPELKLTFHRAVRELNSSPQRVPGWSSLETVLGVEARTAIRRAFKAGLDIQKVEVLAERYVYDRSTMLIVDREMLAGGTFAFKQKDLEQRHGNDLIITERRAYNPVTLLMGSPLRADVHRQGFHPAHEPGAILRYSPAHGLMGDDEAREDEYRVFNIFPGFPVKPASPIDPTIMASAISAMDEMFSLLTQANDGQMMWLKKFDAWTLQHPEEKQQVCPVIVGGQGIGKSIYGCEFHKAIFGSLAGLVDSALLSTDNKFAIEPFIGKVVVFGDEILFEKPGTFNRVKKLIRTVSTSGTEKFKSQRDYDNYARLVLTSNSMDMGFPPDDAADRALFFIMACSADSENKTPKDFLEWTYKKKPFYAQFVKDLLDYSFRQHIVRYFMDLECSMEELEDLSLSSRNDRLVLDVMMSPERKMARRIIAEGRIWPHKDIIAWFKLGHLKGAIERLDGRNTKIAAERVLAEFKRMAVLDQERDGWFKFKYGFGKLIREAGHAHGVPIEETYEAKPGRDWEDNLIRSPEADVPNWRGDEKKSTSRSHFEPREPDYLPDQRDDEPWSFTRQ